MPERSFRIVIQNSSSSLTLNQTFNHLCHGAWTDGGWTPPDSIGPGDSGATQSESDGFMTGTEGYVKYDVNGRGGRHGMIYVYWDNPWYGHTQFRYTTDAHDVYPDCDYTFPEGESTFRDNANLDFTLNFTSYEPETEGGGNITSLCDFANYAAGPVSLLGLAGIDKHPELDLQLDDLVRPPDTPVRALGDLGPVSLKLLTQATPQQWVGGWASGNISVDIALASGSQLSATLFDGSSSPPLSFTDTFTPGPRGLLSSAMSLALSSLIYGQALDPALRAAFSEAARTVLEQAAQGSHSGSAISKRFQSIVEKAKSSTPVAVRQSFARIVGGALGALVQSQGGVAYLSNNVALSLFGMFQSGDQTGRQLQYQRLNLRGNSIESVMLNFVPDIR